MSITVECPGCSKRLTVADEFAGRTGRCPKCKSTFAILGDAAQPANNNLAALQNLLSDGAQQGHKQANRQSRPISNVYSLEKALSRVNGFLITNGLKDKVREAVTADEKVLAVAQAIKQQVTERGSKVELGALGGLRIEKDLKTSKTLGLFAVTSKRVFHVSKMLFQVTFEQLRLDQIESVEFESGLIGGTLRVYGGPHKILQVGVTKDEAKWLCDVINKAMRQPKAEAAAPPADVAGQIDRLSALRRQGILSDEEWERAKGAVLGKPPSHTEQAVLTLQSMYALYKQGVLTESEFNLKKWDVLSRP